MTRRAALTGIALVVVYAVLAAVTSHPTGRRPLFDGFAPPTPYRWVHPPTQFKDVNAKPAAAQRVVQLGPSGSETTAVATSDGQALLSLEAGAIPPHPADREALVRLSPQDASTLGPLPSATRFEGNAYRLTIQQRPSGQALAQLAAVGTLALTSAGLASDLYFSADGRTWQRIDALPFGVHTGLTADIRAAGYYVVTSPGRPYELTGGGGSPAPYVIAGLIVVVLAGVFLARRRWRR